MEIGISTASFYPMLLEEGIELAAELGYSCIELFVNAESEYAPAFCHERRRQLDDLGIRVISLHPFTSAMEGHLLFSDYPRRTKDGIEQYRRYFEAAAILGAKYFTFHGEQLRTRGLPRSSPDAGRFDTYAALCEAAKECGIQFTQENVSWCKSADPHFLRGLYDNVPELAFTLDTKQAIRAGYRWEDYVNAVGSRIVNLHVSDYNEQTDCLLPGQGDCDFLALFDAVSKNGVSPNAIVEVYRTDYQTPKELEQARIYLNSVFN
jgi:sugar phosphate isomerase/epimerase